MFLSLQEHKIELTKDERKVYDEVFSFSQQAMINYMMKAQEKEATKAYMDNVSLKSVYWFFHSLNSNVKLARLLWRVFHDYTLCPHYPDSKVNRDPTSVPVIRILVNGTPHYPDKGSPDNEFCIPRYLDCPDIGDRVYMNKLINLSLLE